jgi:hypothetical protein
VFDHTSILQFIAECFQTLRPVLTESQRAFAHAIDGILASQYRNEALAKQPALHTWDAG